MCNALSIRATSGRRPIDEDWLLAAKQHIGGGQISMNQAHAVNMRERFRQTDGDASSFRQARLPTQAELTPLP
jgi:hypothetical protein